MLEVARALTSNFPVRDYGRTEEKNFEQVTKLTNGRESQESASGYLWLKLLN